MLLSLKILLKSIVDYAGLFPPAKLSMTEAIANYARYQQTQENWMLGHFVVPLSRLTELEQCLVNLAVEDTLFAPRSLSVILSENWRSQLKQIQAFNSDKLRIAAVEFKPLPPEEIKRAIVELPQGIESFFEIPLAENPASYLAVLENAPAAAKIRTGGLTVEAFPDVDRLGQFIFACAKTKVPFKATAGLHHPLFGNYSVSDEPNSLTTTMQGFLNLSILSTLIYWQQVTLEEARKLLQELSISNFQFQADQIIWQNYQVKRSQIQQARQHFFRSFGSCSFQEPLDELRELTLL